MTMTARETADSLAEMTGAFERRRDAILAALLAERKAALAEAAEAGKRAAREMNEHSVGTVVERAILALSPEGKGPDDGWLPIETAPKDKSILAWCDHEADPFYSVDDGRSLTLYAAHAEGLSYAPTGYHIVEWGGAFDDSTWEHPNQGALPDWWFVAGSEFEIAANPTRWRPLPSPPTDHTPEEET